MTLWKSNNYWKLSWWSFYSVLEIGHFLSLSTGSGICWLWMFTSVIIVYVLVLRALSANKFLCRIYHKLMLLTYWHNAYRMHLYSFWRILFTRSSCVDIIRWFTLHIKWSRLCIEGLHDPLPDVLAAEFTGCFFVRCCGKEYSFKLQFVIYARANIRNKLRFVVRMKCIVRCRVPHSCH